MSTHSSPAPLITPKKKPIHWKSIGAAATTISPVFFYLNGQAYHQGYLSYFGLENSMFQLDASATITESSVAWMEVLSRGIKGITSQIEAHPWAFSLFCIIALVFTAITTHLQEKENIKRNAKPQPVAPQPVKASLPKAFGKSAVYVFATGYGLFCITVFILLSLLLAIGPFVALGKRVAAEDLAKGFKTSLQVEVKDTPERAEKLRVIQCSATFCALYSPDEILTIQASDIKKGTSPLPNLLNAKPAT